MATSTPPPVAGLACPGLSDGRPHLWPVCVAFRFPACPPGSLRGSPWRRSSWLRALEWARVPSAQAWGGGATPWCFRSSEHCRQGRGCPWRAPAGQLMKCLPQEARQGLPRLSPPKPGRCWAGLHSPALGPGPFLGSVLRPAEGAAAREAGNPSRSLIPLPVTPRNVYTAGRG